MSLSAVPLPLLRLPAGLPLPAPAAPSPRPRPGFPLLDRIAAEVRLDDEGFRVGGEHCVVTARRWTERPEALTAALAEALHDRYVRQRRTPVADAEDDAAFGRRVRAALGERFFWADGWQAVGTAPDGRLLVEHDDLVLHVEPAEVRRGRRGLQIRFPAELPAAESDRLTVVGAAGPARRSSDLAECYLCALPETAPEVFAGLVAELDALGLPFTAAVLTDPSAGAGTDSIVVRTDREHLPAVARVAVRARRRAPGRFGPAVPAFTRPLGPGVSVADAPAPGVGTGRHRCRVLAAAIVAAGPDADARARLAAIHEALAALGLDASALHLNPGSADVDLSEE